MYDVAILEIFVENRDLIGLKISQTSGKTYHIKKKSALLNFMKCIQGKESGIFFKFKQQFNPPREPTKCSLIPGLEYLNVP